MKTKIIQTKSLEVYNKLNLLNFRSEITLNNMLKKGMGRIEKNINRNEKFIEVKNIGNNYTITKLKPFKLDVYIK